MQQCKKAREIEISTAKPKRDIDPNHKHGFSVKQTVLYYTKLTHRIFLRKPIGLHRADYVRNNRTLKHTASVLTQIFQ